MSCGVSTLRMIIILQVGIAACNAWFKSMSAPMGASGLLRTEICTEMRSSHRCTVKYG